MYNGITKRNKRTIKKNDMKLLDPNIYEQVKQSIIKKLQNQNLFFSKDKQNIGKLITQTKLDEIERAFDLDIGIHFDFTYGYTILDVPKNVAKVKVCFIYIHNLRVWNLVNTDSYDCKNLEQEVNFELYRLIQRNDKAITL